MIEFQMPSLGADMETGTLVKWRRSPGDRVARGDVIAEVETDKGLIEIEVFTGGTIDRFLVEPGTKVPVGAPMAILREEGAPAAPEAAPPPPSREGAPRGSPLARRRAQELGVDLAAVAGTGPDGAIMVADVERAAASAAPAPQGPPADEIGKERMRRAIAAAMTRSKREIPHLYLETTVDMGPALAWLDEANRARSVEDRLVPGVLFTKAVALGLRRVPELNARWESDRASPLPDVHVGVAVSLRGGGLVAPAIHHTDRLGLDALMAAFRDVVERARAGSLRSSEMSDGTITVTSLGERGVEAVFPIIFPPQVAIVGFGKIVERPWVVGGAVVPRPVVTATLAADHRVSDGHRAGLLLAAIASLLEEPEKL